MTMLEIIKERNIQSDDYDAIVLITSSLDLLTGEFESIRHLLELQKNIDPSILEDGTVLPSNLPSKRLVFYPTGPLNRDYDDVRRFYEACEKGIKKAIKAGSKCPLLIVKHKNEFPNCDLVGLLGALLAAYVPIEIRDDIPEKSAKLDKIGFHGNAEVIELAKNLESGRGVARDIGGSDPERMSPPNVEAYVRTVFKDSPVHISVVDNDEELCREYPLFSAVNRCAKGVPRHRGRIIYLTYEGSQPVKQTLLLVGKGVTYDTGGADIKAGGVMAGMHRDKCGAAAVAGVMQVIARLKPQNMKVIGALAMVRNSVGSDCYVADEIITSRAGQRIRVGNTDAEGRMAMADVLCRLKEVAQNEVNPNLMTIATLTGHCVLCYGESYSAIMDNGPALRDGIAMKVQKAGSELADPFEISTIRREDYSFHEGPSEYEDVLQCNNLPSSKTERGHQTPSAFLIMASGLHKHGIDSEHPIKYSHIDIAGGSGPFPGIPTGSPVLALCKAFMPQYF